MTSLFSLWGHGPAGPYKGQGCLVEGHEQARAHGEVWRGRSLWNQCCGHPDTTHLRAPKAKEPYQPPGLMTMILENTAPLQSSVGSKAYSRPQTPQDLTSAELGHPDIRIRATQQPWRQAGLSEAPGATGNHPQTAEGPHVAPAGRSESHFHR